MNFTPNPANALLTGRAQPQVHQAPVTTSSAGPQSGNVQKNSNLLSPPFPNNQQAANMPQKINDDNKNQMAPSQVHHQQQLQQAAQNNNNHGMGGIPQQLINTQHQSNMNRNLNISHQTTFQQPQHNITSSAGQSAPKGGIFHQMQQLAYQSQQFPQATPVSQPPIHASLPGQQNILHKLQAAIPQAIHQIKQVPIQQQQPQQQQQMKAFPIEPVSIQPPPTVSQHNMQYSPPKSVHPQMKTTAKLASPGSQLQSLQKSPTATNPPNPLGQQAASQNKTVPSTPPISSPTSSVAPSLIAVSPQASAPAVVSISQVKSQAPSTPNKQLLVTVSPQLPTTILSPSAPVVPSQSVTAPAQAPSKLTTNLPANTGIEQAPTKDVEQSKESTHPVPTQNKPVPKLIVEEKKAVSAHNNPTLTTESNNKVEKSPAAPIAEKQQLLAAVVSPKAAITPSKSTMRLATVTPARQKKPPATNNKKPPPTTPSIPVVQQKSPAKVAPPVAPVKVVEAPKPTPTSVKKPQVSALATTIPKSNPAPSTSSAQSTTSSASGSATTPKTKRSRVKVQPYQCPTPELALVTKLSTQIANSSNKNGNDDKLTIFYKSEFLAVRNAEGGFYLCQAMHNVYKSSPRIRIRWLNEKNEGKVSENGGRQYNLDFWDNTDFECVLTTVDLDKVDGKAYELSKEEQSRIESILKKAIDVQKGITPRPTVTEENPDGLDLSLYKDEAQLDKISPNKRKRNEESRDYDFEDDDDEDYEATPRKKKSPKRESTTKRPRAAAAKKPAVNDDSTESDEENLMEIKKKAKKQAAISVTLKAEKPLVPEKAPEPTPSTSKASAPPATTPTTGRGRKRAPRSSEIEVPEKIAKTVEKVTIAVKESPTVKPVATKAKPVAKAKPAKKITPEKASPVVVETKPAPEPRPVAEKRPAVKKSLPTEEIKVPATPSPKVVQEKTPAKTSPKKKSPVKAKVSPVITAVAPADQQPSTSRSRNTRSKK